MVLSTVFTDDYPRTGSVVDGRMKAGLSTHILIAVDVGAGIQLAVGAIQSVTINESRNINRLGEIGTQGFVENVPMSNTSIDLNVTRVVFDAYNITRALGRGYKSIGSQRIPFNVYVIDRTHSTRIGISDLGSDFSPGGFIRPPITQIYHNCWFTSKTSTYNSNTYAIIEQAQLACQWHEDVFGTRHGDGERNIEYIGDSIEQAVDEGATIGALPSGDPNERKPISKQTFPFPFSVNIFPFQGKDSRADLGIATATDTLSGFKNTFKSGRKQKINPLQSGAQQAGDVAGNNAAQIARG